MILTIAFNAVWQGALIVVLTEAVLRLARRPNATTRAAAWFLALLAIATIPVATAASRLGAQLLAAMPHGGTVARIAFTLVPLGALSNGATRWATVSPGLAGGIVAAVSALWIGGTAAMLVRLGVSLGRVAQIRGRATQISVAEGIPVLSSDTLAIPIATGIVTPAIVLPQSLIQTLSEHDLRCTVEHELAHVRRGDVASNAVARIVEALFFWNPWIHVAGRRLSHGREAACDDWVVGRTGEPRAYASCLAALARRLSAGSAPLLTPSVLRSRHALVGRIERLMGERLPDDFTLNYFALGAVTMIFAAMTLALQALLPASADAAPAHGRMPAPTVVADAACKTPNAEPAAIDPAPPQLAKSQLPKQPVSAEVTVTIGPDGKPTSARIFRSSGNADVDRAVLTAAEKSTYSPKYVDCKAVTGTYLFRADFKPGP
jgi:TonB family protein